MFRTISVRLIQSIPVLLLVAVLSFILMHLRPESAVVIAGVPRPRSGRVRELGLDLPIWQQLLSWFSIWHKASSAARWC